MHGREDRAVGVVRGGSRLSHGVKLGPRGDAKHPSKVRKMRERRTWQRIRRSLAALLVVPALAFAAGCGEKDESGAAVTSAPETPTVETTEQAPGNREAGPGDDATQNDDGAADPGSRAERRAVAGAQRAYRRYIRAINEADGTTLCNLIAASFQTALELPVPRGSCAERVGASIGYQHPSGAPVWRATELSGFESAIVGKGRRVQLSAAITTQFADRKEPSIESDIVFLEPAGKRNAYRLMKAPGSLWRAVGQPDIPPSVISPPKGF